MVDVTASEDRAESRPISFFCLLQGPRSAGRGPGDAKAATESTAAMKPTRNDVMSFSLPPPAMPVVESVEAPFLGGRRRGSQRARMFKRITNITISQSSYSLAAHQDILELGACNCNTP